MTDVLVAVIRLKGDPGLKVDIRKTFKLLRLYKKNHCVLIPNKKNYVGMLNKIKEACTWGEIDAETCKLLLEKRGRLPGNKPLQESYVKEKLNTTFDQFVQELLSVRKQLSEIPGIKTFFKLTPPRHGFETKGLKAPYSLGGALGYRKENINELLKRMI